MIVFPQSAYNPAPAPVSPYATTLPNGTVVPYFPTFTNYTIMTNATNATVTNYTVTYTYSAGGPFPYPFLFPYNISAINGTNMTALPPSAAPYLPAPGPNPYSGIPAAAPGSYGYPGSPYPAAAAVPVYAAAPGYPANPQVPTLVYAVPPPPPQYYANIPLSEYGTEPGYADEDDDEDDDEDEDDDDDY